MQLESAHQCFTHMTVTVPFFASVAVPVADDQAYELTNAFLLWYLTVGLILKRSIMVLYLLLSSVPGSFFHNSNFVP